MALIQLPCPACHTPIEQGMEHCPGCHRKVTDEFAMQLIAQARSVTTRMSRPAGTPAASPFSTSSAPPIQTAPSTGTRRRTSSTSVSLRVDHESHANLQRAIGVLVLIAVIMGIQFGIAYADVSGKLDAEAKEIPVTVAQLSRLTGGDPKEISEELRSDLSARRLAVQMLCVGVPGFFLLMAVVANWLPTLGMLLGLLGYGGWVYYAWTLDPASLQSGPIFKVLVILALFGGLSAALEHRKVAAAVRRARREEAAAAQGY